MSQANSILKQRLKKSIGRICSQTPKEVAKRNYRNIVKRMGIIDLRTFIGGMWIGRNEPCYCDKEPKLKFKNCHWPEHSVLPRDKRTPETARFAKKIEAYFSKHRRIPE